MDCGGIEINLVVLLVPGIDNGYLSLVQIQVHNFAYKGKRSAGLGQNRNLLRRDHSVTNGVELNRNQCPRPQIIGGGFVTIANNFGSRTNLYPNGLWGKTVIKSHLTAPAIEGQSVHGIRRRSR